MAKPKRHHIVPECYLDGFTRDGLLWVYDRSTEEYRAQTTKNTAVMGHYYAVLNEQGEKDYSVEEMLSTLEGIGAPVVRRLDRGEQIEPEERVNLAFFIALLFNRVPRFEREIDEIADATAKAILKEMFPTVEAAAEHLASSPDDEPRSYSAEDFFHFIHEEKFTLQGNRNNTVRTMLEQTPVLAQELAFMDWMVVHADDRSAFITTDSSWGYLVPDEVRRSCEPVYGIASEKIVKVVTLSCRTALVIGQKGAHFGHFRVGRDRVRDINLAIAAECERYVIGPDEALVRSVVRRSKVDQGCPTSTRMKVEHIRHPTDPTRTLMISRRVPADQFDRPLNVVFED
ncbi:MAG TPA: DUF4238 domain-containing protein [Gemmatimonadaceae bacterium]